MNQLLGLPLEVRLLGLFVLGTVAGAACNWALDHLRESRTFDSPWSPSPKGLPPRRWRHRVPIFGWLMRGGEARPRRRAFWVVPLLIELVLGSLFAGLYAWQVESASLVPRAVPPDAGLLHAQYFLLLILATLAVLASVIDLEERIIPDAITVPGTLAALVLGTLFPSTALLGPTFREGQLVVELLHPASPALFPARLGPRPAVWGLVVGLACFWLWCTALRLLFYWQCAWLIWQRRRRGRVVDQTVSRVRTMFREDPWRWIAPVGTAGIVVTWFFGGAQWQSLVTRLVGLLVAALLVWLVRVIGRIALGREAMGFGDVTLMAMIGAFTGWQPSLFVFFIAPLCGLVLGLSVLLLRGERAIPYGPFLCAATLIVVAQWGTLWAYSEPIFALGWFVPAVMAVGFVLMGVLLFLVQLLKRLVSR